MSLARIARSVSPGPQRRRESRLFAPRFGHRVRQCARLGVRRHGQQPKPVVPQHLKVIGPGRGPRVRHQQGMTHRYPTARRYSGSAQPTPKTIPSTPRPAALRKIEPRFSWSLTLPSTATAWAPSITCGTVSSGGRDAEASTPRLRWNLDHHHHVGVRPCVRRVDVGQILGQLTEPPVGAQQRPGTKPSSACAAPPARPRRSPDPSCLADPACGPHC